MAELVPYPFERLISRMFRELEARQSIFDLPARKFVRGDPAHDLSVEFQMMRASTPLGPAAGPQSQLAQNIVLSFLGGSRIFELKTVQVNDTLSIPRPCIDMQTVGYNVEWSQELKLEQSLEEYVKASMLLQMLIASGKLELSPRFADFVFDLSVGYDLKGVQSPRVQAFLEGMLDATEVVERLRTRIPEEYAWARDLEYRTRLSESATLSTFHGCPPEEIERICEVLMRNYGLSTIVKLNPTLLGKEEARHLFHHVLGYPQRIPDQAFEKDTRWEEACGFVTRLGPLARGAGCRFGVKFTNTLIVENDRDFFPRTEKEMYLSGRPLHVLAMALVARFRERFGTEYPVSFSAGIERGNFPDAVALGLCPVTTCSDLLRPGGYGRLAFYFLDLQKRMDASGARTLGEFTLLGMGNAEAALLKNQEGLIPFYSNAVKSALLGLEKRMRAIGKSYDSEALRVARADPPDACCAYYQTADDLRGAATALWKSWVSRAQLMNTRSYLARLLEDPAYKAAGNAKLPPKVGSRLALFDCITCDKCVPVCPNDANFTYPLPALSVEAATLRQEGGGWKRTGSRRIEVARKHQLANFADFCNDCGNCDVFCPEDGGPYHLKPRFFGSREQWEKWRERDGFFLERSSVLGRFDGKELALELEGTTVRYRGPGFSVRFDRGDPEGTLTGEASSEVDLGYYLVMDWLRQALFAEGAINYLSA